MIGKFGFQTNKKLFSFQRKGEKTLNILDWNNNKNYSSKNNMHDQQMYSRSQVTQYGLRKLIFHIIANFLTA